MDITKKGINFEFENKTDQKVDLDLDISLDNIMEDLYNFETSDIKPHSKHKYFFKGDLTQTEYEKMTVYIEIFGEDNWSFVNEEVRNIDLGGHVKNKRNIKPIKVLYKSPDLVVGYKGTTETGIKLIITNKLKKNIWINFDDLYYNNNIKAPYVSVITLNSNSTEIYEITLNDDEHNFYASELTNFTVAGYTVINSTAKEHFTLNYQK